jgi:two-component system phosphate regulon sensor histidine kinase PhoR
MNFTAGQNPIGASEQNADISASRREFTANVSHELKTPLTVIAGYAELLQNGMATADEIPAFATIIKSEATQMLQLVEDILVISQLDEEEPVQSSAAYASQINLFEFSTEVIKRLQPFATSNQVTLEICCEDTSLNVYGSKDILNKMLYNLVENAIRYNKLNGTVTVSITQECESVHLSVTDTGIGIDTQFHTKVFERFFCVDKSRSRQTGGTGLGLSIVKHGAERMGATVKLTSELGDGTTITLAFNK